MPPFTLPVLNPAALRLSPTDVSQFIRLDQCERYLRLRLHERLHGDRFLRDFDVQPQAVTPLLTRSGRQFETSVEQAVSARFPTLHLGEDAGAGGRRLPDNRGLLQELCSLAPGEEKVLLQPRLQATLEGCFLTGDVDLLRLERDLSGALQILIADIKSSTTAKVEHRLQVAFYHAMLVELLASSPLTATIETAILYRGETAPEEETERAEWTTQREAARTLFGAEALLERVPDAEAYLDAVRDLVTRPDSAARRAASASWEALPYHLTYKCDGCLYNQLCLKHAAETDDLSLIPHLSAPEKGALRRLGLQTIWELATLKELREKQLFPAPGREELNRRAATTWPVGPRMEELIHRARRYRKWMRDGTEALTYFPGAGYGSLPYSDAEQNPNLVRLYLDAQHDYLHDRIYLLGARVVACEGGVPVRSRNVVRLAEGPPDTDAAEQELLGGWLRETLRTIVELAAPDADGELKAPLHLIFYNQWEQRLFLDALARHLHALLDAAPALYDFMTQLAAFDSPIATFLDAEIRELKNYPMVCQSLQAIAQSLRFDWNHPEPYGGEYFYAGLFDSWGRWEETEGEESPWYTARARFNSQLPLEYAYAAWEELPSSEEGQPDPYAAYRRSTPELLQRFHARRLEALEHVARDFPGNKLTQKAPFRLPDLAGFQDRAGSLAQALDEFVTIERHVQLGEWKSRRLPPPERRVLSGETLLVRYVEADQDPATAARMREGREAGARAEALLAAARAENPAATWNDLPKEERDACKWESQGLRFKLRLTVEGCDCSLEEALSLCTLREGDRVLIYPRWSIDERLPEVERVPFQPTPRQMLYGTRLDLLRLHPVEGWAEVEYGNSTFQTHPRGFTFAARNRPLKESGIEGDLYTLDPNPDDFYGSWCARVTEGLREIEEGQQGGRNVLYERLAAPPGPLPVWPEAAQHAQERFREGLDTFAAAERLYAFEESKREYIGRHGTAPLLLVQGPPGTGKSTSTGFAVLARMQGALAAGRDFRCFVTCKTHAATDVLLQSIHSAQSTLRQLRDVDPNLWSRYFDCRLLEAPLYRLSGKQDLGEGIILLPKGATGHMKKLKGSRWCVVGATPGGTYRLFDRKTMFNAALADCLVLDEASQMNLPEAAMASLPLRPEGQLIVVGDHRQMPPIVMHDWGGEPRRTFQEYRAFESVFITLTTLPPPGPPVIRFQESFRLHAAMAEFLREEVYQQDGIPYFSRRTKLLDAVPLGDSFLEAVLSPEHPLVVVVHAEDRSQTRNPFEQVLVTPVLEALAQQYALDAEEGLGVVVPHRAQRAALQRGIPCLTLLDPETGAVLRSAVDTVERFQGGEREAILISATESDREYLLAASEFLLDPRRLTVAVSRAKRKLVLVASQSIFALFSPEEETFKNSQLWKNLLRRTCTEQLWQGERNGVPVTVWGNHQAGANSVPPPTP